MIARIAICLALLGCIFLTYKGDPAPAVAEQTQASTSASKASPFVERSDWPMIIPGKWEDDSGFVTTLLANGSYEQSGREAFTGSVPNAPFAATVEADFSCRVKGMWKLQGEKLHCTILSADQLVVHKFDIRSSQLAPAALKDATIKARQQFMFHITHKLKKVSSTVKFISVERDKIVFLNVAGKQMTAHRIQ